MRKKQKIVIVLVGLCLLAGIVFTIYALNSKQTKTEPEAKEAVAAEVTQPAAEETSAVQAEPETTAQKPVLETTAAAKETTEPVTVQATETTTESPTATENITVPTETPPVNQADKRRALKTYSYTRLYKMLKQRDREGYMNIYKAGEELYPYWEPDENDYMVTSSKDQNMAAPGGTAANDAVTENTYSDTNVRQAGVDEGDIVKTDGKYIYAVGKKNAEESDYRNIIRIVKTANAGMEQTACIDLSALEKEKTTIDIEEIYVKDNRLIVVASQFVEYYYETEDGTVKNYRGAYNRLHDQELVYVITYDVSNPKHIKKSGTVKQQGRYGNSRMVDGYVYLISTYTPYSVIKSSCVPKINGERISYKDVLVDPNADTNTYTSMTAVSVEKPKKAASTKAILMDDAELYMSNENIYLYNDTDYEEETYIVKIAYNKGNIFYECDGSVIGYINDSFSIDEYNGNLRVVTTYTDTEEDEEDWWDSTTYNGLFVLDENLNLVGSIMNLAEEETIKSARFMGDTGYFVTFLETDPLFAVDLSDPMKPRILSELKITGFSSYLHPWGDDLLLGIGQEVAVKATNTVEIGDRLGVKLSMFDISNPTDVREFAKKVIKGDNYTGALEDYKAVLIDQDKNLIGFQFTKWDYKNDEYNSKSYYLVYGYSEKNGFERKLKYRLIGKYWYEEDSYDTRGIYIGKNLYIVEPDAGVTQIALNRFEVRHVMKFEELKN